jgi:glycosyltransferase involved in cell wall biosynthesis
MRIAFLAYRGNMKSGGQGIYLHSLTRTLAERGHEIDCFVGPPYPDPMTWARVEQIENQQFWSATYRKGRGAFLPRPDPFRIFHPLNFYEYAVSRFGYLPEPFAFSLRGARAVLARIRQGVRYDIVHDVQSVSYGLLWLRALGLPVVSTIHHPLTVDRRFSLRRDRNFKDFKGTFTFYPVRTQGRVARRLDGVITSSQVSAHEIVRGFGVRPERIHNVLNGVDLPPPGQLRTRPTPPELLYVGRTGDPNKGLEHLLAAMALLPAEVRLRVLDAFPVETELAEQVRGPRLRDRVDFAGKIPRADLETAYRTATVVVVPSLFEGFGLPAIEGLAAGTPVVATRAGALPEVLGRAGTGKLVAPADPAALAKGISETLEAWPQAQRAALAARSRIEASFSWPQVAERTEAVYRSVLAAA